jgi:aldehyde:ferredoxin oxidoreductase
MECFENGIITKEDTDGIDLRWGNTEAIIDFLKMMGERRGIGDLFADGVKTASEKLGVDKTGEFAIHIGGEELPMHDPKLQPEYFTTYKLDPTPGRHTQYEGAARAEWGVSPGVADKADYSGRGEHHKGASAYMHVVNSLGMCQFVMLAGPNGKMPEWVNSTTGWDTTPEEIIQAGERIANLRMAFSVREGDIVTKRHVPKRVTEPQSGGPLDGVKLDTDLLEKEYLAACDWDLETATPSKAKLEELGLEDVAAVLHA